VINCGSKWKYYLLCDNNMAPFFFNGSTYSKLDEKNRFVLPQQMRYGLIEKGQLQFTLALGLGGSLAIYRKSDIEKIVYKFYSKQHVARYRKFFTLFFSTLHHATCDKLGRVLVPSVLKRAAAIHQEIVIVGVLNKIEVWPLEKYETDLEEFLCGKDEGLDKITAEVFALLDENVSDHGRLMGKEEEYQEI